MMQTMDANHWWFLHIFFQSYHDKDSFFSFTEGMVFFEKLFHWGKRKKNELSSVCEKFEFFC